jgi:hypothetical protein
VFAVFAMIRLRLLAATPSTGLSHSAGNGRCGSYASKPDRTITIEWPGSLAAAQPSQNRA